MKPLPQELINELKSYTGFDENAFIEAHLEENKITSIRLNPFKKAEFDFDVNAPVKWNSSGFYLDKRPSFTHDPLFHAGCYYVQEAGSMFIEHALKACVDFSQAVKVLDLCAAPGGKSTLINSLLNEESLLVANEVVKQRADILAQNLGKWGTTNTIVTNSDPQKFKSFTNYFDAIVVDAPCSGSGLFRKQPEAIDEWSIDNVNLCSARQKRIVADVLLSLKEGGTLIYSTCSYSAAENENVIKWLISDFGMEYVKLDVNENWGIVETEYGYRFYPHLTQSEGFFCAALRKGESSETSVRIAKSKDVKITKTEQETLENFVNTNNHLIIKTGEQYHLINEVVRDFVATAGKELYFKKAGTRLGEIKGKDFVPNHELALSIYLKYDQKEELSIAESIKYLKKEAFLPGTEAQGLYLISYKNYGLGWAKLLQNRVNNYLPNELRILK